MKKQISDISVFYLTLLGRDLQNNHTWRNTSEMYQKMSFFYHELKCNGMTSVMEFMIIVWMGLYTTILKTAMDVQT